MFLLLIDDPYHDLTFVPQICCCLIDIIPYVVRSYEKV